MPDYNIKNQLPPSQNYQNGLLPQRNQKDLWYFDSSCRSNLSRFSLSSENRRINRKTAQFTFEKVSLSEFYFTPKVQKTVFQWIKELGWDFPTSSVKTVFTQHIFNQLYLWKNQENEIVAYSLCYFSSNISHIAYVFYHPQYSHSDLPIRLVLQVIEDSAALGLEYCYLGRFSQQVGYYKRNMPGFEYYQQDYWTTL